MTRDENTRDLMQAFRLPEGEIRPSGDERVLLKAFRSLSRHGRAKAIAYVTALAGLFPGGEEDFLEAAPARRPERREAEPVSPSYPGEVGEEVIPSSRQPERQTEEDNDSRQRSTEIARVLPVKIQRTADPMAEPEDKGAFVPTNQDAFPIVRIAEAQPEKAKSGKGRSLNQRLALKIAEDISEVYGAELLGIKQNGELVILNLLRPANLEGDELFAAICASTLDAAAELFKYEEPMAVSCSYKSPGAEGENLRPYETLTEIILSKPLVEKGLAAFKRKVAIDYNELLKISDEYYIHPSFRALLKKLKL